MDSKTIVITGASDGIGASAAQQLHALGHEVIVVGRSPEKTERVASEIGAKFFVADFTKLSEVRDLATKLGNLPKIDVLANNAGGVFGDREKTEDGFEKTFQINHLAPFLLTTLLLDKLAASNATVVQTSSVAARLAPKIDLQDLDMDKNFGATRAYGAAKLENILFTKELQKRFGSTGVNAVAFHPGAVATSFGSNTTSKLMGFFVKNPLVRSRFVTPEQGAAQLVWFATTAPGAEWQPGEYYDNFKPGKSNKQAADAALASGLWERSEHLLA